MSTKDKPKNTKKECIGIDVNTANIFMIDRLTNKQLRRIARNERFLANYNHLVKSISPEGQDLDSWKFEMINRLKKDPTQFNQLSY